MSINTDSIGSDQGDEINRMLKKASSKAAGSEAPGAYMEYVRRLSD